LAINSGQRIAEVKRTITSDLAAVSPQDCSNLAAPVDGKLAAWIQYENAADGAQKAALGTLRSFVDGFGFEAVAVGPGAAIALADAKGRIEDYYQGSDNLRDFRKAVQTAWAQNPNLLIVDAGTRTGVLEPAQLDERIGAVLDAVDGPVLIASLADWGPPNMGVLIGRDVLDADATPDGAPAVITSQGTRRSGLVLATELNAGISSWLMPAPLGPTQPLRLTSDYPNPVASAEEQEPAARQDESLAASERLPYLQDMALHARALRTISTPGMVIVVALMVLAAAATLIATFSAAREAKNPRRPWWALAIWAALIPASSYLANLIPWWHASVPLLAWAGSTMAIALGLTIVVAGVFRLGPAIWRNWTGAALGGVGLITTGVLGADLFTGQQLAFATPLGLAPLNAARLYGFTNPMFAFFATAAIFVAAFACYASWRKVHRTRLTIAIARVGLAALVLDGAPNLGADYGGTIATTGGFVVLALLAADVHITWRRALLTATICAGAAAIAALVDYLRGPSHWTHIGAFVDRLFEGEALPIIMRKIGMALRLAVPVIALIALILFIVWLILRKKYPGTSPLGAIAPHWRDEPLAKPVTTALVGLWIIGARVNDSSLVILGLGAAFAAPMFAATRALPSSGSAALPPDRTVATKPATNAADL
jgi:hypothetical protein